MSIVQRLFGFVPRLWVNWIALLGTTLTTVSGNAILIVGVVDIVTAGANNYMATFGYLMMPIVFVIGLALIALGIWKDHRRHKAGGEKATIARAYDMVMTDPSSRRRVTFVIVATLLNVTLISVAAFKGITYMNSPTFCGQLCHSVMKPEYGAYRRSPHARVPCVDCHIGAGASWFVRSKLSGMRQVWATFTGDFSRPIPTPVEHLRPARETCEKCHWPSQFHGERLLVRHIFKDDEKNTRQTDVVRLHVGGENRRTLDYEGIHWHVAPDVRIEYDALDRRRTKIGTITMTHKGKTTVFRAPEKSVDGAAGGAAKATKGKKVFERRVMDCVDCHNRPTHIYDPSPEVAVDRALSLRKLDPSLPFLRKQAVALLKDTAWDKSGARGDAKGDEDESKVRERSAAHFTKELKRYFVKAYPEVARTKAASIERAGRELGWIYRRNVFPSLKITWGTYPSHLGHRNTDEGCFRCHDDEHTAKPSGKEEKTVPQDCDLCHEVLAQEEEKPDLPETVLRLGGM